MRKKILIISLFIPYPLSRGGDIAVYYFLAHLSNEYDITFLTEAKSEADFNNLQALKARIPKINVVVQNNIRVKATRLRYFLNWFKKSVKRTLLPGSTQRLKKSREHKVDKLTFETARPEFAHFILDHLKVNQYDFIQLEFFNTLNLLPLLPSGQSKIFVHHELLYKSISRLALFDTELRHYLVASAMCYEHAMVLVADVVVVFNDDDKVLLSEVHKNVVVSPFGIPDSLIVKNKTSSTYGKFIFLGGERHPPNQEGLMWFLDTLYIPNYNMLKWPVYILSAWSDQTKTKYSKYDRIIFTGYVEDLDPIYDGAVLIAPIRSGSGIRTKIIQAFANKVPVFSTPFAAEGLYASELDEHVLFFSDETSFLKICSAVVHDPMVLQQTAENGYNYYETHFNARKLLEMRMQAYR